MPVIHYLEVTIRWESGKLDKFKRSERNLVLYLDTIMRFIQNDLFRRSVLGGTWQFTMPAFPCNVVTSLGQVRRRSS